MELPEEIILRPRFELQLDQSSDKLLNLFEETATTATEFVIKRSDQHVFIKIPKEKQHFWSPQLDIEILSFEEGKSTLHGLFGPKPSVWTLFMFLHFGVATLFIGFGIWAYTNASLDKPYIMQLFMTGLMVLGWFVLYFAGRLGKSAGKKEMHALHHFLMKTLET